MSTPEEDDFKDEAPATEVAMCRVCDVDLDDEDVGNGKDACLRCRHEEALELLETYKDVAAETAKADRSAVCAMGDLLLSGNKQCYSSDAVLRMVRALLERPSVRAALAECKADMREALFGHPRGIQGLPAPERVPFRQPPPEVVRGLLEELRRSWRKDGAEGESVHLLCDLVEHLS